MDNTLMKIAAIGTLLVSFITVYLFVKKGVLD